jgi:hypothetical protein
MRTVNESADFWRVEIGVNVFPTIFRTKKTYVEWSEFEEKPVSEEQHDKWKEDGSFEKGIAVMAGKIWRGKYKGKYLACLDIDNKKGIEEFLSYFGEVGTKEKLAAKTIVEWHRDNPNKVHIYFIVENPLTKKSGITVHNKDNLRNKDEWDIPAIEVKSEGSHGIMIAAPSIHTDGFPYETIGTKIPTVLDETQSEELENVLNLIYEKYNSNYLSGVRTSSSIKELFDPEFTVLEGNNRHEALLRVMESLIARNHVILSEEKIKELAGDWNLKQCKPPLDNNEFERQWRDAKKFITKMGNIDNANKQENEDKVDSTSKIMESIEQRCSEIFYDEFNRLYANLKINNHMECIPLFSNRFKGVVRIEYFDKEKKVLTDDKLDTILKFIESQLMFSEDIKKINLHLRVAKIDEDSIMYDLTNPKWEIIKILKEGWNIIQNNKTPIFKRHDSSSVPQAYPSKDYEEGVFDEFLNMFNLQSNNDKILLSVYIISLFIPLIPKPILILSGEGGGAKTTAFNIIKKVVDPGSTDTIAFPDQINDLVQALDHSYLSFFDNVSSISDKVSDLLCRAVTGSGFKKRALYTDDSDIIYKIKRCIGVNGINLATTRADFLDRAIIIKVERIDNKFRKKEADIERELERLRPYVLGFIFDLLVKVLKYREEHPNEKILQNGYPRMADFAEWGEIIARSIGYEDNEFIKTYYENINNQNDEVIEASPIAETILLFTRDWEAGYKWRGSPSKLYEDLTNMIDQVKPDLKRSNLWPKASNSLTPKINEIKSNLKQKNVDVVTGERDSHGNRIIMITKLPDQRKRVVFDGSSDDYDTKNSDMPMFIEGQEDNDIFFNRNIRRIGYSDTWECDLCSQKEDIHYMKQHICKNNNKN